MLGLKLRDEFLDAHMPGSAISLRTSDNQGAAQKSPEDILSITYPTADVQIALRAIGTKRNGRPIVLMGDRGRGKSHIMAVMHHAIQSPDVVKKWILGWAKKIGSSELTSFEPDKGFFPISEPVHNHEYAFLWDLIFDRHPKGQFYRGQFENMAEHHYPPRTLLEKMFEEQPTALILDEFQTWYTGLPKENPKTGSKPQSWAFTFIQNLSEMAKDRPDILILIISVLDTQNDAYQQTHRVGELLIDFKGSTAKKDRQRLVLHRLFKNRENITKTDIIGIAEVYANERFRILHSDKSEAEKVRICDEVFECWPFSPELLTLLEDHILLSQAAQETRDLIRILAQIYRTRGDQVPLITPADFFVDGKSDEVQSLVDSVAVQVGQEKLIEVAQGNLEAVKDAGVAVPSARELISAIWMRSMSPGKTRGGTPLELHLDITRQQEVDDNAFQAEITLLIENSVNIHGDELPGGPLWFGLAENPRSKVRASAKNKKLWQTGATVSAGQTIYPGKDVEHIRNTLRHIFVPETSQSSSRIVVLGPNWETNPWDDVDETDKPSNWDRPVLLVIPDQIDGGPTAISVRLGVWLAKHVQKRRNTVRFLLAVSGSLGLYSDEELIYSARCSFLCSKDAWGTDAIYRGLHQGFDRPLRKALKARFNRFAVLQKWDYQQPQNCIFEVEKIKEQGSEIPVAVEAKILSDLFDQTEFKKFVIQRAKDSDFVGSLMDDITEPPPPQTGEAIPFLGETKTYEIVLDIAAEGDIALNVNGTWIVRRPEDTSDEDARRYIKSKAFRTGQEMRQIQLGLSGAVGGGTVTAPGDPSAETAIAGTPSGASTPQPFSPVNGGSDKPDINEVESSGIGGMPDEATGTAPVILPTSQTKRSDEPATGINLSGFFEKWGVLPSQTLDTARIEFGDLTAQQVKQILQRIPSTFKAKLEITYKEDGEQ